MKHLIKDSCVDQAASLAKACAELAEFEEKGHFKQIHLVCLCTSAPQELVMEEVSPWTRSLRIHTMASRFEI